MFRWLDRPWDSGKDNLGTLRCQGKFCLISPLGNGWTAQKTWNSSWSSSLGLGRIPGSIAGDLWNAQVGWDGGKSGIWAGMGGWKSWEKIREKIRKRERHERLEILGEKKTEKSRNERPETLGKNGKGGMRSWKSWEKYGKRNPGKIRIRAGMRGWKSWEKWEGKDKKPEILEKYMERKILEKQQQKKAEMRGLISWKNGKGGRRGWKSWEIPGIFESQKSQQNPAPKTASWSSGSSREKDPERKK